MVLIESHCLELVADSLVVIEQDVVFIVSTADDLLRLDVEVDDDDVEGRLSFGCEGSGRKLNERERIAFNFEHHGNPVPTQRRFNVYTTSKKLGRRRMNVKTTLCGTGLVKIELSENQTLQRVDSETLF